MFMCKKAITYLETGDTPIRLRFYYYTHRPMSDNDYLELRKNHLLLITLLGIWYKWKRVRIHLRCPIYFTK